MERYSVKDKPLKPEQMVKRPNKSIWRQNADNST